MAFAGSLAKADILLQNCLQRQEVRRSIVRDAQQTMVRSMRKHCEALASQDVPGARHGVVHLCDALAADDVAGLALALTESGQVSFEVRSGCTKVLQNDLERSTFGRSTCSRANIAAVADLVAAGIVLPAVALRCCSLHGTGGQLPERVSKLLRKRDTYVEVKMKDGTWRTGRIEGVLPGDFFGMTFWRPDGSEFRMRVSRRAQMRRMKRAQDTLEVGSSVQVKMPNGVWRRGQVHQAMGGDGFVVKFLRRDGSEALMRVPGSAAVRPDQGPPGADRHVEVKIGDNWVDAFLIGVCDNQEFRVLLSGEHDSREILVPGDTPVRPILGSNRTKHQD
mmetsp:Transcript_8452/g.20200  ORF Transcript_8452/g.20200 Transcript_8452/m.20200 type:complete len:335 (-) Transcript_8452:211-1215(-)